eukprot:14250578-Ditylum_brightwellii.AAC.1
MFKQIQFSQHDAVVNSSSVEFLSIPCLTPPTHAVKKIIFSPTHPKAPAHMVKFAKTTPKAEWKESMLENYKKIDTSGTLTAPLLRSDLPSDAKILCTQTAFKVKSQEEVNMYELYTCASAKGASQIE